MKRKRDSIKVLETGNQDIGRAIGLQCINCKERHYFVSRPVDANALFCTNCGHTTPLRTAKRSRGLSAPLTQQQTVILQNDAQKKRIRKPRGINDGRTNQLAQDLVNKGFTVIDSQVTTPS